LNTGSSQLKSDSGDILFDLEDKLCLELFSVSLYSIMAAPEVKSSSASDTTQLAEESLEKDNATDGSGIVGHPDPQAQSASIEAKKPFKFKVTVFTLCLISVVVAMDSVIVASTLPAITVALKGTSLKAFWVGTSYLLAQTVSILPTFHLS
jgi:hypothetical protein